MMPYNIKTEAGKALWNQMNQEQGSVVWGAVGKGIEAIEAEIEARIIKLLEKHFGNSEGCPCDLCWKFCGIELLLALIKGDAH